jgi:hypothetical protein
MSAPQDTAIYIGLADTTKPADSMLASNLGAALRQAKIQYKTTLPNLDGAVTATDTEMNYLVGVTGAIQTQINNTLERHASGSNKMNRELPIRMDLPTLTFEDTSDSAARIDCDGDAGGLKARIRFDYSGKTWKATIYGVDGETVLSSWTLSESAFICDVPVSCSDPTTDGQAVNRGYGDTRYCLVSDTYATQAWVAASYLTQVPADHVTGGRMAIIGTQYAPDFSAGAVSDTKGGQAAYWKETVLVDGFYVFVLIQSGSDTYYHYSGATGYTREITPGESFWFDGTDDFIGCDAAIGSVITFLRQI